jgi:uncharacterized membrane protein
MKSFWQQLSDSLKGRHPGTIGAVAGLTLALSLVLFGLWKTLFMIGMTFLGYFLGVRYFSNREALRNLLDKILPPGLFR